MNRRVRPIDRAFDVTVLDRIEMDVRHVTIQIVIVPNLVLPISPLPDAALPLAQPARADRLTLCKSARKPRLDERPARRLVRIVFGQAPDRVQMIGQDHHRDDLERVALPGQSLHGSQRFNVRNQQIALAIREIDGEKESPACDE